MQLQSHKQPVMQERNGTAQTWSMCNKGSHSFTCHPHVNHSLCVLPAAGHNLDWLISGHIQKSTENIPVWRWHVATHLRLWRIWGI